MPSLDKPNLAYEFLLEHYASGEPFSRDDLAQAMGWKPETVRTYITKKWKELLEKQTDGRYRVKLEFRRFTKPEFLQHFSQKTPVFGRYTRVRYESLVAYEFLLPLARELELRSMLDELFYSDALVNRLRDMGASSVERWCTRAKGVTDAEFLSSAAAAVGEVIGGYSISHVAGRFRAHDLMTRADAADLEKNFGRYLIDETTASVRFLLRVPSSRAYADAFDFPGELATESEVDRIRAMFISVFAEAVVRRVKEEDEIWLIEESDIGRRLFVWQREDRFEAA